jgi:hypothetical protein
MIGRDCGDVIKTSFTFRSNRACLSPCLTEIEGVDLLLSKTEAHKTAGGLVPPPRPPAQKATLLRHANLPHRFLSKTAEFCRIWEATPHRFYAPRFLRGGNRLLRFLSEMEVTNMLYLF